MDEYAVINIMVEVKASLLHKNRGSVDDAFDELADTIHDATKNFELRFADFKCKVELDVVG